MNKVFYWSPFTTKVATVKSVLNSADSINRFFNRKYFQVSIIDAVHEWKDFEEEIKEKKIELIYLNKTSIFNSFQKDGFLKSRLAYWYIFFKSFFPLIKILQEKKPDYFVIHLITSLPLILFTLKKFKPKLILRISGLPKMTLLRKFLWKLASKNIYKITCPTTDTFNKLSRYEFLKKKLHVLNDPIINVNQIQKLRKKDVKINDNLNHIISNKKFLLSIGRFTKQKNFLFYLNCIPEILKLDKDLFFLFIGDGEEKNLFIDMCKKLNIIDKVFVIDYTDNVHFFMKKSKAFILTSLWEDPGFVLVEAGYNNCQVISSNCPNGPKEIISNDGGYLFESNSKESFVNVIKKYVVDSEENKKLKKTNLKKRIKNFSSFQHYLAIKKILS